jgi:hypothetical protein
MEQYTSGAFPYEIIESTLKHINQQVVRLFSDLDYPQTKE